MDAHLIRDYRNLPGEHCGSTAMRNLLFHYCGLELSEEEVFGLGSGIDCVVMRGESLTPPLLLFGRSATMETDVGDALGVDYREQTESDDEVAWHVVREEVAAGRPTMLSGDAYYLSYRDFRVHFPAHRFVLVGFDDARRIAWVADRLDAQAQQCDYDALAQSRNPRDFLSTMNMWGRFADATPRRSLVEAFELAIARAAERMTGHRRDDGHSLETLAVSDRFEVATGLSALPALAEALPTLPEHPGSKEIARYASACIESFGTGGGNFRTMYARFLQRAREVVPHVVGTDAPGLARDSSATWTQLSRQLSAYAKDEAAGLGDATELIDRIRSLETRLFESLAGR